MKPFTLLIKPSSADCNLRCEYCFYLEKRNLYPDATFHRMPTAVLEQMIKSYMATEQPSYIFGWQGGEPTLMGLDFFRKVTRYQEKYGHSGALVSNGLQTNAMLVNDEMAEHFRRYHFLVGCSLDGPAELHDRYRRTIGGEPSHTHVMKGIEALKRHHVDFNILVLVSRSNVRRAREVYRYLVDQGFLYQQYIPCVEYNESGTRLPFAINGDEWGMFMCELFDEWYRKDVFTVSIRHFDSILIKMVDREISVCVMGRNCCQYLVVEYNGDIYPCDFFVLEELKLGNVMNTSWEEALASRTYRDFGLQKTKWNEACDMCDCLDLCNGDCLKYRNYENHASHNLSCLCAGWKQFIRYTRRRFEDLAGEVRRQRKEKEVEHS